MSRSEMKKYLVVILSITLLRVPELLHARPDAAGSEELKQDDEALLKFNLMHVDHPDSPFYVRDRTVAERFKASLSRSRNWEAFRGSNPSRATSQGVNPTTFVSPLSYSQAGIFIVPISIGTPSREFPVILDTGSDLTWVQCSPCSACYDQADPLFDPTKSRTYSKISCDSEVCSKMRSPQTQCNRTIEGSDGVCQYRVLYGDDSTTAGELSRDVITMTSLSGRTKELDFQFGCGHKNQGTFESTDGIVGFGRDSLSLPSQLGPSFGNIFSYCLDVVENYTPLLFGKGISRANFSWSPLIKNEALPSFYFMNVTGISVNGTLLEIPPSAFGTDVLSGGGFIIDSGTTVTLLVPAAYEPLVAAMSALVPYPRIANSAQILGVDLCFDTANFTNPDFPGAVFHLDGDVEVPLPARNLWVAVDEQGSICLALVPSPFGFNIFGNIQQMDIHIAYDLQNNRLGFQTGVNCNSL